MFAYERLDGLDRERVLQAIDPILRAHRVQGVELEWKTDSQGRVLQLTVESTGPDGAVPERGAGPAVTLEACSELSRDISAALDVADCIGPGYRLEVGSPGVERALYRLQDYKRFEGQLVTIKLAHPHDGQWTLEGQLRSVGEGGVVTLDGRSGEVNIDFENIKRGRLVYEFGRTNTRVTKGSGKKKRPHKHLER